MSLLLAGLGFRVAGVHRSKPVTWWRNGEAHVLLNGASDLEDRWATALERPAVKALALVAEDVANDCRLHLGVQGCHSGSASTTASVRRTRPCDSLPNRPSPLMPAPRNPRRGRTELLRSGADSGPLGPGPQPVSDRSLHTV